MQENLDIELLQTLIAIADTGSFSSASASVHRTQSAVSMQMKRLEQIIGQPLFEKNGRRSVLTVAGHNLLLYARRIIGLQQEALAQFRSPDVHGEVRIGVCDDYTAFFMPPILASFSQTYPRVHIRLESQPSGNLIDATHNGDLDFCLVNILRPDLQHELLTREPMVWVTSRDHTAHEQTPLPLAIETTCPWGKWALDALDKAKVPYRIGYSTISSGGINAIVDAGLAVAIMTRSTVPSTMRILQESECFPALPYTQIGLVMGTGKLSSAAHLLAEAVRQNLTAKSIAA